MKTEYSINIESVDFKPAMEIKGFIRYENKQIDQFEKTPEQLRFYSCSNFERLSKVFDSVNESLAGMIEFIDHFEIEKDEPIRDYWSSYQEANNDHKFTDADGNSLIIKRGIDDSFEATFPVDSDLIAKHLEFIELLNK